jgi:hypothetical protein
VIRLFRNETNVHSLHISKNSKIKPHVDVGNCCASIIIWINNGNIKGDDFATHGLWYKFSTSNGATMFLTLETIVYGTLQFQSKEVIVKDFKLGLALVNKKRICTQLINQKLEGIAPTFSRTWSSITTKYDMGEDLKKILENDLIKFNII